MKIKIIGGPLEVIFILKFESGIVFVLKSNGGVNDLAPLQKVFLYAARRIPEDSCRWC